MILYGPDYMSSLYLQKVNNKLKALKRKYSGAGSPIWVVVVKCRYSGVELAAKVSERLEDKGMVQANNVETTIWMHFFFSLLTPWLVSSFIYLLLAVQTWNHDSLSPFSLIGVSCICGFYEQATMPRYTFGTFLSKLISLLQNYIKILVNSWNLCHLERRTSWQVDNECRL